MDGSLGSDNQLTFLCDSPWGKSFSILIVEDHEIVREGLHRLITSALGNSSSSIVVSYAPSLREADAIITSNHSHPFDLVLLDLELEDAHPRDCMECIRTRWAGLPVAIVTANDDWDMGLELMACGVLGVISKRSSVAIVVNAIRLIAAGGRYFPDEILMRAKKSSLELLTRSPARPSAGQQAVQKSRENLLERLSPRQQAVLSLMAQGMSNKEIARSLSLSVGTAKNYVSSVLRAIGATRRSTAIRLAAEMERSNTRAGGKPISSL